MAIKVNTGITPKKASTNSIEGVIGRANTDGTVSVGTGTRDHAKIYNKDLPDQHPIIAITGLADALKQIGVTENNLELAVKDLAKHLPTDTAPAKVEVKNGVLILTLINGEVIKFAPGTSENAVKSVNGIKPDKTGNVQLDSNTILLNSSLFQDVKDDIARIEADTVKLGKKVDAFGKEIQGYDSRIAEAEAKADEAKAKADSVNAKADAAVKTANNALTKATAANKAAEEAKTAAEAVAGKADEALEKAGEALTKAEAAEGKVSTLETTVKNINVNVTKLGNRTTALETKTAGLESQIGSISDDLDAVKTKVDELPSATELESELAAKQDKIDAEHPIDIESVSGLQDILDTIPEDYLVDATKSEDGKTLTITKADGSTVEFQGGSEGAVYSEGNGIDISEDNVISVDQAELDAGISTTKIAAGGIPKGTDLSGKSINEVLEMLLAPYIAPTIGTLTLTAAAGTVEIGSSKTLTKFKCTYTANDGSITKAALYDGSTLLAESTGSSYTSGTDITLSESKTYTSNKTLTCKLTTEKGAILTKDGSYSFATYLYTGSAASTDAPTTGLTKQSSYSTTNGCNVTFGTGHYVFFYTDSAKTKIQQYAACSWNDMETTDCGKVTITLANGTEKEYFAYRTDKLGESDTWQLKIV